MGHGTINPDCTNQDLLSSYKLVKVFMTFLNWDAIATYNIVYPISYAVKCLFEVNKVGVPYAGLLCASISIICSSVKICSQSQYEQCFQKPACSSRRPGEVCPQHL